MKKVLDAIETLRTAETAIKEILHPTVITIDDGKVGIQVQTLRDLEQVPGQIKHKDLGDNGNLLPIWAEKNFKDIRFYCVTSRDEFASLVLNP